MNTELYSVPEYRCKYKYRINNRKSAASSSRRRRKFISPNQYNI